MPTPPWSSVLPAKNSLLPTTQRADASLRPLTTPVKVESKLKGSPESLEAGGPPYAGPGRTERHRGDRRDRGSGIGELPQSRDAAQGNGRGFSGAQHLWLPVSRRGRSAETL